jgi:hypothetical protein
MHGAATAPNALDKSTEIVERVESSTFIIEERAGINVHARLFTDLAGIEK